MGALHDGGSPVNWDRVNKTETCWLWTGALTAEGYGSLGHDGRICYAHRVAYEELVGPIPDGRVIDHLCRNRACVNPDHLEAVTQQENTLRGARSYALTGRCRSGRHEIKSDEDTQPAGRWRRCRACTTERIRAHQERSLGL